MAPRQYEAIRDKFIAEGKPTAEAKTRAAKIYNSTHHDNPVTRATPKMEEHPVAKARRMTHEKTLKDLKRHA